ncbi:MAG: IS30 family transposase [Actinomycetota bacterium]|nr:IS30 family transposase [Actinomycetota bacterium]
MSASGPPGPLPAPSRGTGEGDLITGASSKSAIGTLVDRATRFTILLHLPGRHAAEAVRDALIAVMSMLPLELHWSLTWDQGKEMALHKDVSAALGMPVYFCGKASPVAAAGQREHLMVQAWTAGAHLTEGRRRGRPGDSENTCSKSLPLICPRAARGESLLGGSDLMEAC